MTRSSQYIERRITSGAAAFLACFWPVLVRSGLELELGLGVGFGSTPVP